MAHDIPKIKADRRDRLGSKYAARLRREGRLPVVIYGHKQDPIHVAVDQRTVVDCLDDGAHLLEVEHDAGSETCLIKDVQYDHLGDTLIHLDLARVDLNEEVTVSVPIVIKHQDRCAALNEAGAFLEHSLTDMSVRCLVNAIPDEILVDVSGLGLGESITVADLKLPEGVASEESEDTTVAAIHVVAEEEVEEVAEAADQPEVIGAKPEEEGEGEGEDKDKSS